MRFAPYAEAAATPNIIVDGAATTNTVLTLSHWPRSGTPAALRADTSTEIVFRYLDSPASDVPAEVVSNNHFDEDGLLGMHALLNPTHAERHRDLLIDSAQAGDFGVFARRDAARVAFAIAAYADAETSPLGAALFRRPYPATAAELYAVLLELLPRLLDHLDEYTSLWQRQDADLAASEALIDRGQITIGERPDLDLATVWLPDGVAVHPFALHSRTPCTRLLVRQGARVELRYRYESWVQMASRRPALRVDLSALAAELNDVERPDARWVFEGVDQLTPRLFLDSPLPSALTSDEVAARIEHHLRTQPPAWNPYQPAGRRATPREYS